MTSPRRTCGCGCGEDISHRDARAKYVDNVHKQRRFDQEGKVRKPLADAAEDGDLPPDIAITKAKQALEDLEIKRIQKERETLDLAKARGEVVPFDEVAGEFARRAIAVRTKLLGVPSAFKQKHPYLAIEAVEDLERLIRRALEELVKEESSVADDEPGNPGADGTGA